MIGTKQTKKVISWFLTLAMLLSLMPSFTLGVSASDGTDGNIYKQMLEYIAPENNYGLGDIPESRIFHAWGWSYQNIQARLEDIAKQGFSTILVSPPNEISMSTKDADFQEGWQRLYQPAGFQINESQDNALGTKAEFIELCDTENVIGLKIMVEAVVGYAGTNDNDNNVSTDPIAHVNPRMAEFEPEIFAARAFHDPWVNCTYKNNYWDGWSDYDIEEDLTQHAIDGKPDLATETQLVQDAIYDYFVELTEAGADGFYFNDAKYIETSSDTYFASDFWEDTLGKIREYYPEKKLPAIAEIINGSGDGRSAEEYLQYGMKLTNTAMSDVIRESVINGEELTADFDEAFPQENSVLWSESYKSYANGETSALTSEQRAKIWALTVSRNGGKGIYLARPSDELAENKDEVNNILSNVTLGEVNVIDLGTEAVKRVNHFASFFEHADEDVHYDNGFAVIERGEVGAVLVNMQGKEATVSLSENTLVNGNYTDAITGNKFTVENGKITGEIGESGIAVLYLSDDVSLYNIWVGGERLTSNNLDIDSTDNANITGSATYDSATNTLTLNNFTYSGDGNISAVIRHIGSDDLKLVLEGTSSVTCTDGISYGVDAWGNIEISGSGSLSVIGGNFGVNAVGDITVLSGSLLATGGNYGVNAMGDITVLSGSLLATGDSSGVNVMGDLAVNGGSITATGGSYGVHTMSSIAVNSGSLTATGSSRGVYIWPMNTITIGSGMKVYDADGQQIETPDYSNLTYVRIAGNTYTITFNPNGGSVDTSSITTVDGKLESLPTPTRSGYNFKGWYDAETGGNKITTDTVFNDDTTVYAQWSKKSSGGGGGSNTTTTTTKNDDGSTTKVTENKATGTKTEVTTNTDGSTTTVETKKDGTVTTTEKDKDGNTTTTVEKPDGTTTTTEKDSEGNKTVTTEKADGTTTTEETKKDGTKVTTETNADGETKTEIDLPKDKETEVTIPVPDAEDVTSITVTDKDGKETEITDFEVTDDGVKMSVSGDCTAAINKVAKKEFADVHPADHWAIADVDYVFTKGLMNGVSETHFAPNDNLTRAMLVTVLYRLEGEPATNRSIPFADVDMGAYYANAVIWAKQNGIVNGVTENEFAPNDNITREQIAAIMHRYAKYKGYDVTVGENTNILSYDDFDSISEYAIASMQYACGSGLMKGKTESTLNPKDNATRAEIAAILHRFIEANK